MGVFVDGVDVEIVPGVGAVVAGAGLVGVEGEKGICCSEILAACVWLLQGKGE